MDNIKAPDDENFLTILDGNYCEENGFTNSFPKLNGVYEVKCRVHWDDGRNAFFEPTDPDLEIEIIEHKLLVLSKGERKMEDIKKNISDRGNKIKSYFTGKVIEEKWMTGYITIPEDGYVCNERYNGIRTPLGYWNFRAREYNKIKERKVFYEDDLNISFKEGWKVNINDEVVIIEEVVYNLDGSVTYHTDKEVERIIHNTCEEAELEALKRIFL